MPPTSAKVAMRLQLRFYANELALPNAKAPARPGLQGCRTPHPGRGGQTRYYGEMFIRHRNSWTRSIHSSMMSSVKPLLKSSKPRPGHRRSTDVAHSALHPLDAIFVPRTVAVIGASERPGSI